MTKEELLKLLMVVQSSFPNWKIPDKQVLLDTWYMFFGEYEYNQVAMALKTYISQDTTGFAPSIGQLNNLINTIQEQVDGELNEMEAWSMVSKALRDSTYHSEERFNELPPLVQKAVGSHENLRNWAVTDAESVENVLMSNFQRTYRTELQRAKQTRRMPVDVRQMIERKQQGLLE